ncbi:FAD-binding domain-containing protein [Agrocybe pediades]|nr:FAD-binding domain-containing protein [Agrocybe pediades]
MHLILAGAAISTLFTNVQGQAIAASVAAGPGLALSPALVGLNNSLGGRLAVGTPWAKPCFSSFNGVPQKPDAAACSFVQQNYFDVHLPRSQAFGAYSATQYETCMATGDQCLLNFMNAADPAAFAPPADCRQGSVPPFYIDVQSSNDVVEAMNFAKNTGTTLVIKNTGHDFKGRSSAPNSLALWMLHMKSMSKSTNFVPDGCKTKGVTAITIGAGVQFADLYAFADQNGLEVVGGTDQTVGAAGGYLQGGGHSSITPSAGMAADRALQFKIVTTDGSVRTANACQNSDLFFALRGGGGGTFGVVMEATVLATPRRTYQIASINWPVGNDAALPKIMAMFVDNATALATEGWGGYLTPSTGSFVITNPNLSLSQAQKSVQSLIDLSTSLGGVSNVTTVGSFLDWFNAFVDNKLTVQQDAVGLPNALTSRLIPQANHATAASRAQLTEALLNAINNTIFSQIHITTPFGFKGTDGKDTSVNPIWRTSLYQIILVNTWLPGDTLAIRQGAFADSTKAVNFLRDITPNSGAYHNEADIHEPNFQDSFWGKNYPKLLAIKNKYDPTHLLDCWHCVGWKGANQKQFQCYI